MNYTELESAGARRWLTPEWMHRMTNELTRIMATMVLLGSLAVATAATEEKDIDPATQDARVTGKVLIEPAHDAAVKDAIEAVLAGNRMELDIRFADRTSEIVVDGP